MSHFIEHFNLSLTYVKVFKIESIYLHFMRAPWAKELKMLIKYTLFLISDTYGILTSNDGLRHKEKQVTMWLIIGYEPFKPIDPRKSWIIY